MANKKYEPMPDMSNVKDTINRTFKNISFKKANGFSFRLFHTCVFYNCNFEDMYFQDCAFNNCSFINCNLKNTNWRGVNMDNVTFRESKLIGSAFSSPHIVASYFKHCSLRNTLFKNFNFYDVNFSGSILYDAVFRNGYFINSRMHPIKIIEADLGELEYVTEPYKNASFYDIDFINSWFGNINFNRFSTMWHCYFNRVTFNSSCKNIPYIPMTCPEEGSFIAYKKVLKRPILGYNGTCDWFENNKNVMIAVLEIPADAKRSSGAGTRKCRCNKAKVLRFEDLDGNVLTDITDGYSYYNKRSIYHVGKYVTEENFDEDRWKTCSRGIHFFMNRQEAINYDFN